MKVYVNVYTEWGDDDKHEDEYMGAWSTPELAEAQIKPLEDKIKAANNLKYPCTWQEQNKLQWDDPIKTEYRKILDQKWKWKGKTVDTIELELDKPTEHWK